MTRYGYVSVSGVRIFYREAGPPDAPTLLLLHGFPSSSHMFRGLFTRLADRFHLVAPDFPGFGFSEAPPRDRFAYSFAHLASVVGAFTDALGLDRYAIYVFDYGAPIGYRLALDRPDSIEAIISQNGNAYEEGLAESWNPIQQYWRDPTPQNRAALREFLSPEMTKWQYTHGVSDGVVI